MSKGIPAWRKAETIREYLLRDMTTKPPLELGKHGKEPDASSFDVKCLKAAGCRPSAPPI